MPEIRMGRNGGTLAPKFEKGAGSPNPGGRPKGFVPLSQAYATLATLHEDTIRQIAESGKLPADWQRERCFTYVVAARAWDELRSRPVPGLLSELADRTEGKVPQKVQAEMDIRGVIVVPASSLASADWSRNVLDAEVIDSKSLPAASEDNESA